MGVGFPRVSVWGTPGGVGVRLAAWGHALLVWARLWRGSPVLGSGVGGAVVAWGVGEAPLGGGVG